MKKTLVILSREYRMRLRRPAFWVLTLLVPLLLAALYAIPVIAANAAAERSTVLVVDETGLFGSLQSTDEVAFLPQPDYDHAHECMEQSDSLSAVLYIVREHNVIYANLYHRDNQPPQTVVNAVNMQLQLRQRHLLFDYVYDSLGLSADERQAVEKGIRLRTFDFDTSRESFATVRTVAATVLAVLMVLALLVFGIQVMRSVQEEKSNRMAEVLASSVKPVQLLIGKIAGIALAAVTQIVLWVFLTVAAIGLIRSANPEVFEQARVQQEAAASIATKGAEATAQYHNPVQLVDDTLQGLGEINWLVPTFFFLFFLLGYLLYGALLAALAARLDSDADALQWVLLVLSPLLLTLLLIPLMLNSINGTLATLLTYIPFTAPATVLLRLPFPHSLGIVDVTVVALLMLLLAALAALLAARTYKRHLV
ncbi:MAG: ABC transporter permease [Bacteroidales bacterium]|nr:ABC transporter permease [Bacteroidales bacterium]